MRVIWRGETNVSDDKWWGDNVRSHYRVEKQILSASEAELWILDTEQEIKKLQSKLRVLETSSGKSKKKGEAVITSLYFIELKKEGRGGVA